MKKTTICKDFLMGGRDAGGDVIHLINRRKLAEAAGVSESYLSCIFNGTRPMSSLRTFRRIAGILRIDMENLMDMINSNRKDTSADAES